MIDHLQCSRCATSLPADRPQNVCRCGGPLLARYDLAKIGARWRREDVDRVRADLWQWREVLPIEEGEEPLTLGEGGTALLGSRRIGPALGLSGLSFKDETTNPTGSFKARGLAVAIHRARVLGARRITIPSAGNAGVAAAAYSAAADLECTVAMPRETPASFARVCRAYGATVEQVDGSIADAAAWIRSNPGQNGGFDMSTLREPYRIEGKKTMGYEIARQMRWELPDAVVYPTGGGTGLIGMWKAFDEMEAMGWVGAGRPKMIAVQASGCAPIVAAFDRDATRADPVADPRTIAAGLRVPSALGDSLILGILRASGGAAVSVSDAALLEGARSLAREEGILGSPEAGATIAALPTLMERGIIGPGDRIICFITGHGGRYETMLDR